MDRKQTYEESQDMGLGARLWESLLEGEVMGKSVRGRGQGSVFGGEVK